MINKCQLVRETCSWAVQHVTHVKINREKLAQLAEKYQPGKKFTEDDFHKTSEDSERALLQIFMIDFSNFCFWPLPNFQYAQLASNIQQSVKEGITLQQLSVITEEDTITKVFHGIKITQAHERARILRELGKVTLNQFGGSLVSVVQSAGQSAVKLLNILTSNYPNFQDHTIYKGSQIHFYKRAQILIGDIYGNFHGKGLGAFTDIDQLTMYPDYRVPQVFQDEGVFEYSQALWKTISNKEEITDREIEVEIRASTVVAVQEMKHILLKQAKEAISIELDWFLWQRGQNNLQNLKPHHRCLTIYY